MNYYWSEERPKQVATHHTHGWLTFPFKDVVINRLAQRSLYNTSPHAAHKKQFRMEHRSRHKSPNYNSSKETRIFMTSVDTDFLGLTTPAIFKAHKLNFYKTWTFYSLKGTILKSKTNKNPLIQESKCQTGGEYSQQTPDHPEPKDTYESRQQGTRRQPSSCVKGKVTNCY